MKDLPILATFVWLVRDTFRQSLAQGIFWVLLVISVLSIGVCLTISVLVWSSGTLPFRAEWPGDLFVT